jgi:hypothetical protein
MIHNNFVVLDKIYLSLVKINGFISETVVYKASHLRLSGRVRSGVSLLFMDLFL